MIDWLADLKDVFPEAVELAIQMPPPRLESTRIVGFLAENRTWESHPEDGGSIIDLSVQMHYTETLSEFSEGDC